MSPDRAAEPRPRGALLLGAIPLGVAALMAVGVATLHRDSVGRPEGVAPLERAEFAGLTSSAGPDARPASGETRPLPHDWRADAPELLRGRYAFAFDAQPDAPIALYAPGVNTRAEVRVNGHLLTGVADVPGLASRLWLVPLYRSIPGALLHAGPNQLEIDLEVDDPGTGFLGPVYLGDDARLRPAFELRRFLQVTGIQILVIALVSIGAFLALLSVLRGKDTTYLWFGVVLWIFAFGFWNLLAIESRIPKPPYRWVGAVTMGWLIAAIVVFVHRFLGERHPRAELALAAAVALVSVFFWVTLGTPVYLAAIPVWGAAVLVVSIYPAVRVTRRFLAAPDRDMALVLTSGALLAGASAHDIALANGAFGPGHDFAIQYASLVSAAIFAFLFLTRLIEALDTSEALGSELAERVEQKAAEIERSHAQLRHLENERAVTRERERIMGEIHDGMGGQLVSALALVRHGDGHPEAVADALQAALDDMRLMIYSLEDVESDLGTLLGSLRTRIGRRLEQSGLALEWRIADTPAIADFGPEAALQAMRIAQEAITNVMKHAGASTLRVSTWVEKPSDEGDAPRFVVMEIADDGRGFAGDAGEGGKGLSNMRARARRIGGELEVESEPGQGTRVRVRLPAVA